ncbi:MAG: AIR synthase-related protein, partial [Rivularia sp. (in: cyanobacteria)]
KLVVAVGNENADKVLSAMKSHPAGKNAAIIGEVTDSPQGIVTLKTSFGAERIIDMLVGEQLPRIC